jgi:inosose dehydratase
VLPSHIRLANAPCSWGTIEFESGLEQRIGYAQMLDELRASGYVGTELGDWGFMPTEPTALAGQLGQRNLEMAGGFVPVAFRDPATHAEGEARALRTAELLRQVSASQRHPPLIVLADESCSDPVRTGEAGRVQPDQGLSDADWATFAAGVERIARAVRQATGLRSAFHPHCAGFVETPAETARLLELTDPRLVGLTFDTGHVAYGSGRDDPQAILDCLDQFGDRVWHVHFKDCDPSIAARARAERWDYHRAIRQGLFCELGHGLVDFPAVLDRLRARDYRGWIVVEQDVLPGLGTPLQSAARSRAYLANLGL